MPYDPRMLQLARMGVGMMAPPFEREQPRQRQWWDQPQPSGKGGNSIGDYPSQPPGAPSGPAVGNQPGLLEMMTTLGRMSRPEYDKAIQGGPYKDPAKYDPSRPTLGDPRGWMQWR